MVSTHAAATRAASLVRSFAIPEERARAYRSSFSSACGRSGGLPFAALVADLCRKSKLPHCDKSNLTISVSSILGADKRCCCVLRVSRWGRASTLWWRKWVHGSCWQVLIPTAPFEEDVELFVADVDGSLYGLNHPCRRNADGWVRSDTRTPLTVTPVR